MNLLCENQTKYNINKQIIRTFTFLSSVKYLHKTFFRYNLSIITHTKIINRSATLV